MDKLLIVWSSGEIEVAKKLVLLLAVSFYLVVIGMKHI